MNVKIDTMKSPNEIPEESRKRRLEDLDAGSLIGFRSYTREEEAEERFLRVSTKLKLLIDGNESNDPWKIKKTLTQSDCNHLYRLTLCKDMVQNHIIKVWEEAGRVDEIEKVVSDEGVAIKVWDCEREREYELKLKKLSSSKSFIISGAWRTKFVFSVLARAPPIPVSERENLRSTMNVKIDTMKSPNEIPEESRKRRLEDLDAGSLRLSTPSCYTNCDAAVFEKPENSTFDSALNIRIAKNISGFRSYTREEEARE
ncbi:hypothetical protein ACET3Z_021587 [Daucus carota]